MKKITLILGALVALASGIASAATINLGNYDSDSTLRSQMRPVVTTAGDKVADGGGFAAIGYFTSADAALSATNLGSFQQFGASVTFGGVTTGSNGSNRSGLFFSPFQANIPVGSEFDGKSVYVVVGNGTTLQNSTEVGVIKTSLTFPADNPVGAASLFLAGGPPFANTTTLVGNNNGPLTTAFASVGNVQSFQLVPAVVPEPSIALLGLMGVGLARRRRA